MATQRTPRNSGHLSSVANTLAAQATPPGGGLGIGTPRNLPTLNGMRAPAPPPPVNRPVMPLGGAVSAGPPPPVNRPVMPLGGAVSAGPPPPMGALPQSQVGPPTDLRAILAKLFQGGGGGGQPLG
jgi:hypothetical protein